MVCELHGVCVDISADPRPLVAASPLRVPHTTAPLESHQRIHVTLLSVKPPSGLVTFWIFNPVHEANSMQVRACALRWARLQPAGTVEVVTEFVSALIS